MVLANNFKSYFKLCLGMTSLAVNWLSEMFLEVNLKAASAAEHPASSSFPAAVAPVTLAFLHFWCHVEIES